jgi:hypothetical protein
LPGTPARCATRTRATGPATECHDPDLLHVPATVAAVKRLVGILVCVAVSAVAALGALRLTLPADDPSSVRRQLTFLRQQLDQGAGSAAQASFPEGYFFLHVLYGLTEVQLGLGEPPADRAGPLAAATWALTRLESPEGRAPFDADGRDRLAAPA